MIARAVLVSLVVGVLACDAEAPPESESETEVDIDTDGETGDDEGESSGEEAGLSAIACDEQPVITFDTFGRGFLATYCNGCHGGEVVDRKGAPPTVVFDDHDSASTFADRILLRVVDADGLPPMPPTGGVTEEDRERARIWLTCYE